MCWKWIDFQEIFIEPKNKNKLNLEKFNFKTEISDKVWFLLSLNNQIYKKNS